MKKNRWSWRSRFCCFSTWPDGCWAQGQRPEPLRPAGLAVQPVFDVYKNGILIKAENTKSCHLKDTLPLAKGQSGHGWLRLHCTGGVVLRLKMQESHQVSLTKEGASPSSRESLLFHLISTRCKFALFKKIRRKDDSVCLEEHIDLCLFKNGTNRKFHLIVLAPFKI